MLLYLVPLNAFQMNIIELIVQSGTDSLFHRSKMKEYITHFRCCSLYYILKRVSSQATSKIPSSKEYIGIWG
jgi:hypothetical protein